jgi:hypothetical protein
MKEEEKLKHKNTLINNHLHSISGVLFQLHTLNITILSVIHQLKLSCKQSMNRIETLTLRISKVKFKLFTFDQLKNTSPKLLKTETNSSFKTKSSNNKNSNNDCNDNSNNYDNSIKRKPTLKILKKVLDKRKNSEDNNQMIMWNKNNNNELKLIELKRYVHQNFGEQLCESNVTSTNSNTSTSNFYNSPSISSNTSLTQPNTSFNISVNSNIQNENYLISDYLSLNQRL